MALNGVLIESEIRARNIDALNKFAISTTVDVAGGGLVKLVPPTTQGEDRWTATAPATGSLTGLYMAYNPSKHLTEVNGKYFADLTIDPRDYTNLKNMTFTAYKPQVGDEIVITVDCVDSTGTTAVAGNFLEAKDGQTTFTTNATASPTASTTSYKIESVNIQPFPQAGIGISNYKAFKCVCVQE